MKGINPSIEGSKKDVVRIIVLYLGKMIKFPRSIGFLLLVVVLLIVSRNAGAQTRITSLLPETMNFNDSVITMQQHEYLRTIYGQILRRSTRDVLNGSEYELYYPVTGSNPLFPHERYPNGRVVIEGVEYEPVVIQYDTYIDQLIYFDPRHHIGQLVIPVILNKFSIDEFELGITGDRMFFKYIDFPDSPVYPDDGFYEMIYEGASRLMYRYNSILAVTNGEYIFKIRKVKILENDHKYYRITGKNSLFKALSDKKKDMRNYLKEKKLHVRIADKKDFRNILTFYDRIRDDR